MQDLPCGFRCLVGDLTHAPQEELQPAFPIALIPDSHKAAVVFIAMSSQVMAQIQQRAAQKSALTKQECDQEPANTPVAVHEGMDCLKLSVHKARHDRDRKIDLGMQEGLEASQRIHHLRRWRWHKRRFPEGAARWTYPVLRRAKLTRVPLSTSGSRKKPLVDFTYQAQGQRKIIQTLQAVVHRVNVIDDLFDICREPLPCGISFIFEDIH